MSQDAEIEALHNINKRILRDQAQDLPSITLTDGSKVQTGTVGALLVNIKNYDRICAGEIVEDYTKDLLEEMLTVPVLLLWRIGMFDLFTPEEWLAGPSEGKKFVGMKGQELRSKGSTL